MDALSELLESLKKDTRIQKHFLGLLHVLIGRRITAADGQLVSSGLSWRDLAGKLKKIRWDPDAVKELGMEPADLPPRDRQRYWYVAITQAQVGSEAALAGADQVAAVLGELGYTVSSSPKQ